ncbi:MAG: ORF6N domain-containing protein [Bacilli bacterium]
MNEIVVKENIKIEDMIYEIRGKKVMLDSDLAMLFGYQTKDLNRNVKNNINRFPSNYCFKLTEEEYDSLRCNFFTLKNGRGEHRKYLPYVFTEYGITMLAGILKSDLAVKMSLQIVNVFITMKNYLNTNFIEQKYINKLVLEHDSKIDLILDKLNTREENNHIFYEGQIYDAYSLLMDILSKAKKEIIIIDNYAGKKLFDIIKDIKVNIKVYTQNIDNIAKEKYELQYNNLTIINTDIFHDRFIMIDKKILYHCGASFKDLGKKCFCISKIEDKQIIKDLIIRLGGIVDE